MQDALTRAVEAAYPDILKTVEFLTVTDRGSEYLPGLEQTARFLEEKLVSLECEIARHEDETYGATLVGRKKGTGEATLFFFAHMDTIWPVGTCSEWPYQLDEDYAYGPGVSDCTNGIIGSLYMLEALNAIDFDHYKELIILFNPDEEITSPSSTKWIEHYAKTADVAFCMEGPDNGDEYISSRGGSAYFEIKVKGKRAHAGVEPENGCDAIQELVFKLNEIQTHPIPDAYLCVVDIDGGSGDCTVADNATALLRYRIQTFDPVEEIQALMDRVEQTTFIEGTETDIQYLKGAGFGPMVKQPWVEKFCVLVEQASQNFGMPLKEVYCGGGDDAVSAAKWAPTLDGLAPLASGCHTRDEKLALKTIVPRIALLSEIVWRICSDPKYLREKNVSAREEVAA